MSEKTNNEVIRPSNDAQRPPANERPSIDAGPAPRDERAAIDAGPAAADVRPASDDEPAVENPTGPEQPAAEERRAGIAGRFRGFLPVIVDVETGGFNSATDALLEVAAILVRLNPAGDLELGERFRYLVKPFEGSRLDPASLQITGIDPFHPLRPAVDEGEALRAMFNEIRKELKEQQCNRAILVGHNSFFDLQFLNAAVERAKIKRNPFHPFSSFDTVTLAGVAYGQTVLGRAVVAAGFDWNDDNAHSALYDAEKTGELFCTIVNRFRPLYGA